MKRKTGQKRGDPRREKRLDVNGHREVKTQKPDCMDGNQKLDGDKGSGEGEGKLAKRRL